MNPIIGRCQPSFSEFIGNFAEVSLGGQLSASIAEVAPKAWVEVVFFVLVTGEAESL
jgi:hypothetical protein